MPLVAPAAELVYTIQVGSFANENDARESYGSVSDQLDESQLDHLRIEKIGRFYAVRIGNFENQETAKEFLQTAGSLFSSSTVMTAYIKQERLVEIYSVHTADRVDRDAVLKGAEPAVQAAGVHAAPEKKPGAAPQTETTGSKGDSGEPVATREETRVIQQSVPDSGSGSAELGLREPAEAESGGNNLNVILPLAALFLFAGIFVVSRFLRRRRSNYSVQTGSFLNEEDARENYTYLVKMLKAGDLESLRIEKTGKNYSVRLGKFNDQQEAAHLLETIKPRFPAAMTVKTCIKDNRIVTMYAAQSESGQAQGESTREEIRQVHTEERAPVSAFSGNPDSRGEGAGHNSGNGGDPVKKDDEPLTIKECKDVVVRNPKMAEAYNALGIAYSRAGIYKYAINAYKDAIKIKPDYAEAYCNLGIACNKLGMLKDAVKSHKKAIKIKPDYAEAHYNIGIAYIWSEMYDEAIKSSKLAIQLKPDFADAFNSLGIACSKSGMYKNAIEAHKQAVNIKPDFADAYNNLGIACSNSGIYKDAIESYTQAIKIKPDYAEAHNNLGIAYSKSGMFQEAIESYKRAVEIKPNYAEAHNNLGIAYSQEDLMDNAIEAYKRAIKIKPNYNEARLHLENAYSKSGI